MSRTLIHSAGRMLSAILLHPRWRHSKTVGWTYQQMYLLGKHIIEWREVAAIWRLHTPGMVVADIGANVGFYTLQMALCVGPTGRVLAFEPDPFCFEWLQYRIKQGGAINIKAQQVALGERSREAVLYSSRYNRADNRIHRSHNEPNV